MECRQGSRRPSLWYWAAMFVVAGAVWPGAARAAENSGATSDHIIAVTYEVGRITAAIGKALGIDQSQAGVMLVQILISEARGAGQPLRAAGLRFIDGKRGPMLLASQTGNGHFLIRTILEDIRNKGIRHWRDAATTVPAATAADEPPQTAPHVLPAAPTLSPAARAADPNRDGKQVQIEITCMSVAPDQAKQLMQSGRVAIEGSGVAAAVARMKEAGPPIHVMSSPVVVTPSGREATLEIGDAKEYLIGFKDGKPERTEGFTGTCLRTRPTLGGEDRVRIELRLAVAEPRKGEVVYSVRDPAGGENVQIKLPAVAKTEVQTAVEMRLGQTVVLEGPMQKAGLAKSLRTILMVRATVPTRQYKTLKEQETAVTEGILHAEWSGTFDTDDGKVVVERTVRNRTER